MTSLKLKIKINNSYESEPSSGSGSSLSEHHDCTVSDDENMNLPYLLKPPSYQNEVTVTTTILGSQSPALTSAGRKTGKECDLRYGIPVNSSQESSFEGFSDSSFGKIQRTIYEYNKATKAAKKLAVVEPQHSYQQLENKETHDPSPGKLVFAKFYDTIIEENSCNAVDLLLSNEPDNSQNCASNFSNDPNTNPSSHLSFNGKIKSMTNPSPTTMEQVPAQELSIVAHPRLPVLLETSLNASQLTESFILKKYSNEKSPDLFGDDDDDEADGEDGEQTLYEEVEVLEEVEEEPQHDLSTNKSLNCPTESSFADDQTMDCSNTQSGVRDLESMYRANCRREKELYRRIRKCLAGVPPPPALTIPQLDVITTVLNRKDDILNFHNQETFASSDSCTSLFKPTHSLEETMSMGWKDVLGVRQHGLSFNLSKASENNEYLSLSVIERFIGAETASSYLNSPSSAKKRNARLKLLTQSPGNRLSHLAKRRAMFSSANLANTTLKSTSTLGPQIMLDKRKAKNRRKGTPKRKTPGSKKKNVRKTPSSSARKRLYHCDMIKPGPSRETSKRALFQSPAKSLQQKHVAPKPTFTPEIATRVEKSKRALFSPENHSLSSTQSSFVLSGNNPHTSQSQTLSGSSVFGSSSQLESMLMKRKRHAADDDEDDTAELTAQSSKIFRGSGQTLTPRALKIKSQSFCIGAGSSNSNNMNMCASSSNGMRSATLTSSRNLGLSSSQMLHSSSNTMAANGKLVRAFSETTATTNSLTENQRKKLLWAVSQALQEKKITAKHESFKQYASVLARVVRRIFQEYYQRSSTSNSETMLRLAKKYSYNVISGKNVDDIYFNAKAQIDESKRKSTSRLSGYIGPEEYQNRKCSQQLSQTPSLTSVHGSMQNLFGIDNSMDSFGISQTSSAFTPASGIMTASQASSTAPYSQDTTQQTTKIVQQKYSQPLPPIQPNPALSNSSSKSNLCGMALRENVDCEQRRSAQKNFTGKDQRNVSPYAAVGPIRLGSGVKAQSSIVHDLHAASTAKAKRQISFDS